MRGSQSICDGNSIRIAFFLDEKTRGEDVRGSIHGRGHEDGEKLLQTRPNHIANKKGSTGRVLKVKANYFALTSAGQWQVFHYHVEFSPELENAAIRNALLVQQRETLGGFLYDRGASIYLIRQLEPKMEFQTRDREGREYLMKLTRVGIISALEIQYLQVLNIIMKKASHSLNLQLVGRDYYDPAAAVSFNIFFLFIFLAKILIKSSFSDSDPRISITAMAWLRYINSATRKSHYDEC